MLLDWMIAAVTPVVLTTPFTVMVPLVNGLLLLVHEMLCPAARAHPPRPLRAHRQDPGRQRLGHRHRRILRRPRRGGRDLIRDRAPGASDDPASLVWETPSLGTGFSVVTTALPIS